MAIIDADYVKARYAQVGSNADSTMLADAITAAQTMAENYCGIEFDSGAVTEYHDSEYHVVEIRLGKRNVDSGETFGLYFDRGWGWASSSEVDSDSYNVDYDNGIVYLPQDYPPWPRAWKVIYTGGWTTADAPTLLKVAVAEIAAAVYSRMKDGSIGVVADYVGDNKREYEALLTNDVKAKLGAYKRWL